MKLTVFPLVFTLGIAVHSAYGLKCYSCNSITDNCDKETLDEKDCGAYKMCRVRWSLNNKGEYKITERSCSSESENDFCEVSQFTGTCYCEGEKCNKQPSALLESDTSRIECLHCNGGDCSKIDSAAAVGSLGTAIKCPVGVSRCKITQSMDRGGVSTFTRSCDEGSYKKVDGWDILETSCTSNNMGYTEKCVCKGSSCNTGFQGIKCKTYTVGQSVSNNNNNYPVKCLTGVNKCRSRFVDLDDIYKGYTYDCGVEATGEDGCDYKKNIFFNDYHEECLCSGDECDPQSGSTIFKPNTALFLSMLAIIVSFAKL